MSGITFADAQELLAHYGQSHVLRWFDSLSPEERERLLHQVSQLDLAGLTRAFTAPPADSRHSIEPYEAVIRPDADQRRDQALVEGRAALSAGKVATLLVAGGQGTRLGFDGPKGAFPIGAVSGHSLFQIHAERQLAIGRRYGIVPPLYVMTSAVNHAETCDLFARNNNFGLPSDRLIIFQQAQAPCVDEQGKLLLNTPADIAMSPNGNGGLFAGLQEHGALEHMVEHAIEALSYIQVDNPLAVGCDPLFVGYHLLEHSEFSCKAIDKHSPLERAGSFARIDQRLQVVEYTELPHQLAHQTDKGGQLLYGLCNPGLFVWNRCFVERQAARRDLPVHKAHKKIAHVDSTGRQVEPSKPCGYKFECFAMDTLGDAKRSLVLWCNRAAEFAPVKNPSGPDSAASARELMTALYGQWVRAAGGHIEDCKAQIEISPLRALDAADLTTNLPQGLTIAGDTFLAPL